MVEMVPMNGGAGDTSYANNSLFQQNIISMTWPITKEAITQLYCTSYPTSLAIADLGCSSGPNTLVFVSNLIREVEKIRHQLDKKSPLEYQIFFNDLHTNDFNLLFKSLPTFHQNLKTHIGNHDLGPCFLAGVPGSFYNRLFPRASLHFVHSSYSLHWLSQVPEGVESNKGNIFISDTSPKVVQEAYHCQFQKDFSTFLKCRAEELVVGGRMVLTSSARTCEDRVNKECCYAWEFLNLALIDMVSEGVVEKEKMDSFNIPVYMPSLAEVEAEVLREGRFVIESLQISRINWNLSTNELNGSSKGSVKSGYNFAKCIRSVAEGLIVRHFGEEIIDTLFNSLRSTDREMEAIKILHTNSGVGHDSYAKNSLLQHKAISIAWPIIKEALQHLCAQNIPTTFAIADLGCASGPNTLMIVSNLVKQVHQFYQNLPKQSLHYQIFFNDLHANDFNLIFRSLPGFLENLKTQIGDDFGPCFFNGVPGSFYGRLFPNKSLHFVHSSSSLHWLSQVPEGMEMENKGNIFIDTTSPQNVIEAFHRQFQKDFSVFLKCRGEEVVAGGGMVLTVLGRTDKEYCYAFELFNLALKKMVAEGMVEEEKVDRFNMPIFTPTPEEVKAEIQKEGSFMIKRVEVLRIDWNFYGNNTEIDASSWGVGLDSSYYIANCIRSVIEPIMIPHFGQAIIEELFDRYKKIVKDEMFNKKSEFIFLTISLTTI